MRKSITEPRFERDVRRVKRRKKDIEKLLKVVTLLERYGYLPPSFHPHKLSGIYDGIWECHIEHDWLLLYTISSSEIILTRTGSHSDLFE